MPAGEQPNRVSRRRRSAVKLRLRAFRTVLGLAGVTALPALGQETEPAAEWRDTVLDNGLQIVALRNPVIPAATIVIALRNGAFVQSEPGQEGLPHLVEHMFFKSFAGGRISSQAGEIDATYNGATEVETVTYYMIVPARNVKKGIEIIAKAVRSPRFPKDDLKEEKKRLRNELERNAANPFYVLNFRTNEVLWGPAFNLKNVGGYLPAVLATTPDALEDHYRRFYVPNNAALIVTGDISPQEVIDEATKRLRSWERGPDPFESYSHPPVPPLPGDTIVLVEADAPDVTLRITWQGPSVADDREGAIAAGLFSNLVTQRVSGAYRRLVDSGLLQSFSLSYKNSNHVGPITLAARTVPLQAAAAATALRAEIAMMDSPDYFTDQELELARRSRDVRNAFRRESAISLALNLADRWSLVGIDTDDEEELEVGVEEVRSFVSRYISGQPKALIMLASTHTIDTYADALIACMDEWERK
jgi:zinc protease